jgi:hypothetical protein
MSALDLEPDFAETRVRTVTLPVSPAAPWLARQLLAQWCREWELSSTAVDEAMVVMSELVTECVAAGAAAVTVGATVGEDQLEVAVAGPAAPSVSARPGADEDVAVQRMDVVRGLGASVVELPGPDGRTVVVAVPLRQAP